MDIFNQFKSLEELAKLDQLELEKLEFRIDILK